MSLRAKLESLLALAATPLLLASAAIAQNPQPIAPLAPLGTGTPLPEPLTWTLVGMATVGVGFAARRRKNAESSEADPQSGS
jgi:hypothetical protein